MFFCLDIIRHSKKKNGITTKIGIIFPEVSKEPLLDLPPMIQKNLEMTYIKDREVLYSDVDINQHMNNNTLYSMGIGFD